MESTRIEMSQTCTITFVLLNLENLKLDETYYYYNALVDNSLTPSLT